MQEDDLEFLQNHNLYFSYLIFEAGPHGVALAGLELAT